MLKILKLHNEELKPKIVILDFEAGAIKVFKREFTTDEHKEIVKGYYWHYGKCFCINTQSAGLSLDYVN